MGAAGAATVETIFAVLVRTQEASTAEIRLVPLPGEARNAQAAQVARFAADCADFCGFAGLFCSRAACAFGRLRLRCDRGSSSALRSRLAADPRCSRFETYSWPSTGPTCGGSRPR